MNDNPSHAPSSELTRYVLPLIVTGSITFTILGATSVWIPVYAGIFHVTPAVIGLIGSVQLVMSALVMLSWAPRLLRSVQVRTLMVCGVATLVVIELLSTLLAPGVALFTLLRVVEGSSVGVATGAVGVLASSTSNPARSFGLLQIAQTVAMTTLYGLSVLVLARFGVHGIFALMTAGVLIALPFARATGKLELQRAAKVEAGSDKAHFPTLGFLAIAAIFLVNVSTSTHMGDFAARIGMSVAQASGILAIGGALAIVAGLLATILAGRAPGWLIFSVSGVISCTGLLAIGFVQTPALLVAAACASLFGNQLATPQIMAIVSSADKTGRAATAAQAAVMTGIALGPATGGLIETYASLQMLGVVCAVLVPLALVAAWSLSRRRPLVMAYTGSVSKESA
jgi:predicted MFS family arabinose efflux permease